MGKSGYECALCRYLDEKMLLGGEIGVRKSSDVEKRLILK